MTATQGITGYPAAAELRHAYRENLAEPLHSQNLCRIGAQPSRDAVSITADWHVVLPESAGEQTQTAVADFRCFMKVSMATPVGVPLAPDQAKSGEFIRLELAPQQFEVPESYSVEAGPDGIKIKGADHTGLQYALYELEEQMAEAGGPFLPRQVISRQPWLRTRILRSFFAPYYENELLADEDYYPEGYLNRLAHHRINGIWLHLKLRDVVPSQVFPEFGNDAPATLAALRQLVARTGRYGIRVYIYLNEPRAFAQDDSFWERYPHLRGAASSSIMDGKPATFALCSSQPEVLEFLENSSQRLFAEVPALGGVVLITASEHHTHCHSHHSKGAPGPHPFEQGLGGCPRCAKRQPEEIVTEIISAIRRGIHRSAPAAEVIAWNWSWEMLWGEQCERRIVESLPEDCTVMAGFERGGWKTVLGKRLEIDEYALSFTGPSERFVRTSQQAQRRGLPVYAKLQFVNTHELASVPHLPLPGVVYDKFAGMHESGVSGMLGCWTFGNYPGLITELAAQTYFEPFPQDRQAVLGRLAAAYFGEAAAPDVVAAWDWFAKAWNLYPFSILLLYRGPQVRGPAFPWYLEPIHKPVPGNYRHDQLPGDNLLGIIPDQDVLWFDKVLGKLLERWAWGLQALERAFAKIPEPTLEQYQEYGLARCIYHQMASLRNTMRFYVEREFMLRSPDLETRKAVLQRLQLHIHEEVANAQACLPYAAADSRLGWHSEAFDYQFTPESIRARIADLRVMAEETIPEWLANDSGLVQPQPYSEPLSDDLYKEVAARLKNVELTQGIFPQS